MSARYEFVICDVFTERALAGNQLAVFLAGASVPEALPGPLAQEIHFSETVYVYPPERGGTARIRIFTPAGEIPFAGHPTLGSGALVARLEKLDDIVLETSKGPVPLRFTFSGDWAASGWMRQPTPTVMPFADPRLLPALGLGRPSKLLARVDGTRDRVERIEVGGSMVAVGEGAFRGDLPAALG